MKKIFILALIFLLAISFVTPAYCGDALKKLTRGTCNIITCPFEIFERIQRVNNSDGPMAAVTYGAVKGLGMMVVRAVVGAYEVVTFPIPLPKHYDPILTDPEFFFEDMSW